jgi:hypothetical protein
MEAITCQRKGDNGCSDREMTMHDDRAQREHADREKDRAGAGDKERDGRLVRKLVGSAGIARRCRKQQREGQKRKIDQAVVQARYVQIDVWKEIIVGCRQHQIEPQERDESPIEAALF